jgi:uncharacterized peroxidase-related enzyme
MAFIELVADDDARGEVADFFDADRRRLGYVANYTRAFAHRPAVYAAWRQLVRAILAEMDERRYELATLTAARRLRSTYCTLAHGKVLADRFFDADAVRALVGDHRSAGLDELDVAVMDLAEKVAADATSVTDQDVARLRRLGLSDAEIVDVVVAAAARSFFSKTLDALGVPADAAFHELEPELREALTVGRPIEAPA